MNVEILKEYFKYSSDLIVKNIKGINIVYLESLCSSDKINEYVLKVLSLSKNIKNLDNVLVGPNTIKIKDNYIFYLYNGYTLVLGTNNYAIETKGNLIRSVSNPTSQPSIMGAKDAFNESIQNNLGLIKRRIKSEHLINKDFIIGRISKTKVSVVYLDNVCEQYIVNDISKKLNKIDIDGIIDSTDITGFLFNESSTPFPLYYLSERPDNVSTLLLEGKVIIIVDNSPFVIILPVFFVDFINPTVDNYNKNININFVKIIRFFCYFISLLAPALYVSFINYNQESIPLDLLISFSVQRSNVPIPAALEAIIMLILCEILKESDIRFPSSYGSSISILGALILGEAAVEASIVSPIMIIVIAITFITNLIFNDNETINSIKLMRFLFVLFAVILGLYGVIICFFLFLIHLCSIKTFNKPYTYPIAPYDSIYLSKTLIKKRITKNKYRGKYLSKNRIKQGDIK